MYVRKNGGNNTMNRQNIYVPVGVIGSGKTHFLKELRIHNPLLMAISKDAIRLMLYGSYCYKPPYEDMIEVIKEDLLYTLLKEGLDVFVDGTNLTVSQRAGIINMVKQSGIPSPNINAIYFVPRKKYLKRRLQDPRGCSEKTWSDVFSQQCKQFSKPTLHEGFTTVREWIDPKDESQSEENIYYVNQFRYCQKNGLKMFAPKNECPKCSTKIWILPEIKKKANNELITSCPICHKSFC